MADGFTVTIEPEVRHRTWSSIALVGADGLRRDNEHDDAAFYATARKRPFFGDATSAAIRAQHARILPATAARVLDLMSSMTSHLPELPGCEVVGLGLNQEEMLRNGSLAERVVQDLNRNPRLPFDDATFDAVTCSGSIDLLTHPIEVTRDVARVLRKGGVFVVTFTDRSIQPKSIHAWREADDHGRQVLATAYFSFSGAFLRPFVEVHELKLASCVVAGPGAFLGDESLTAVWGYRPPASDMVGETRDRIERVAVPSDRHCPYCGKLMSLWQPPETPWELDYNATLLYVCFHDDCAYFQRGAKWCRRSGMRCSSYRHSRNPATGTEGPLPVPTRWALKAGIVEET